MASEHWQTGGVDTQFNLALPTAQANDLTLPAGAMMQKFLIRRCSFQAKNKGGSESAMFAMSLRWVVSFVGGPNTGRIIWSSYRDIPIEMGFDSLDVINTYQALWHAGDLELGADQRSIYGKRSDPAMTIRFAYSVVPDRFTNFGALFGEWSFQYAVLYQTVP